MNDRKPGLCLTPAPTGRVQTGAPAGEADAIRLRSLSRAFGCARLPWRRGDDQAPVEVLRDITLDVRAGEILGLLGANGAGKTTLLEVLATVQRPTGGRATVGGHDLIDEAGAVRRIVGYCPSSSETFYPRLTGGANLEFFAALQGLSPRAARCRVQAVLEMVGGTDLRPVIFQRCSAGMKQKLSLARALLADPPVLLLDEPTRSLDPVARGEFQELVRRTLADALGKTILLVTHDEHEAAQVCDRIALLADGTLAGVWPAAPWPALRLSAVRAEAPVLRRRQA